MKWFRAAQLCFDKIRYLIASELLFMRPGKSNKAAIMAIFFARAFVRY
jgi:hypothetical protein